MTKEHDCVLVPWRRAAEAAGLELPGHALHVATVKGRAQQVEFHALEAVPTI